MKPGLYDNKNLIAAWDELEVDNISNIIETDMVETPFCPESVITPMINILSKYCKEFSNNYKLVIKDGIDKIGAYTFAECNFLKEVVLPNGIVSIGENAFRNCRYITKINILDSVKWIEHAAFIGCVLLSEITLPDNLEKLGSGAFSCCHGLKYVNNIPGKICTMNYPQLGAAKLGFQSCKALGFDL